MPKVKAPSSTTSKRKRRPGLTPEARENQLISLAVDRAEEMLEDGTAPAQIIVHYLKMASTRERLELKRIEQEIELQKAKTKAIDNSEESRVLYENALKAMRKYSGHGDSDEEY